MSILATAAGTGCRTSGSKPDPGSGSEPPAEVDRTAWGASIPAAGTSLLRAELERRVEPAEEEPTPRELWSLGRAADDQVPEVLLSRIDGGNDPAALGALALVDPQPASRGEPAAAPAEVEDALWTRYAITEATGEAAALLLAISRLGGARSVERLAVDLAELPGGDDLRYRQGMTALGVLCQRGHAMNEAARDAVAQGLEAATPEARGAAAFALRRCVGPSAELLSQAGERDVLVDRLTGLVTDDPPAGARPAWQALGALGEMPRTVPPSILGAEPPPWLVEVEAVRALAASGPGRKALLDRLVVADLSRFTGPRAHVLLAALSLLRPIVGAGDSEVAAKLVALGERLEDARATAEGRQIKAMGLAFCDLELLRAIDSGRLDRLRSCAEPELDLPEHFAEELAVEALLNMGKAMPKEARVEQLLAAARDERSAVAAAGLWALAELDDPGAPPVLRAALDRDDVAVVAAAAGSVAARSADSGKRDLEAVEPLRRVVGRLDNETGVEARIAAIDALASLARAPRSAVKPGEAGANPEQAADKAVYTGKKSKQVEVADWLGDVVLPLAEDDSVAVRRAARRAVLGEEALVTDFDRRRAAAPPPAAFGKDLATAIEEPRVRGLRFVTQAGTFEMGFSGVEAPINQANLVSLVRAGYFEGLRFHRVVPGFVAQGGDPRGDGYGGPGYLVPCEWSNLAYERGTVGMALAGKDTGGSQFFIAQSRQAHLDARYTVVGHVDMGLDVIDALLPHDRIERVELIE